MDDITRVIEGMNKISGYDCQQMSLFDNDVFIRGMAQEASELLKSQQAEIERLQQEKDDAITVIEDLKEEIKELRMTACG